MALWLPINEDVITQPKGSVIKQGTTPNNVLMALANVPANAQNILGIRIEDVAPGGTGIASSFEPGALLRLDAEPNLGDIMYVSEVVLGSGTISPPSLPIALGYAYEKVLSAGIWYARLIPVGSILAGNFVGITPYIEISGPYSITNADGTVVITSGTFPITLPTAVGISGKPFTIKNSGSGTPSLIAQVGELIDGETSQPISPNSAITVISTGTGWIIT